MGCKGDSLSCLTNEWSSSGTSESTPLINTSFFLYLSNITSMLLVALIFRLSSVSLVKLLQQVLHHQAQTVCSRGKQKTTMVHCSRKLSGSKACGEEKFERDAMGGGRDSSGELRQMFLSGKSHYETIERRRIQDDIKHTIASIQKSLSAVDED